MDDKKKADLNKAALLLRFRTAHPTIKSRKYESYKTIASILKLTQNEVQHICRKALKPKKNIDQQTTCKKA